MTSIYKAEQPEYLNWIEARVSATELENLHKENEALYVEIAGDMRWIESVIQDDDSVLMTIHHAGQAILNLDDQVNVKFKPGATAEQPAPIDAENKYLKHWKKPSNRNIKRVYVIDTDFALWTELRWGIVDTAGMPVYEKEQPDPIDEQPTNAEYAGRLSAATKAYHRWINSTQDEQTDEATRELEYMDYIRALEALHFYLMQCEQRPTRPADRDTIPF